MATVCNTEPVACVLSFGWGDGCEGGCAELRVGVKPGDAPDRESISWVTPGSRDASIVAVGVVAGVR